MPELPNNYNLVETLNNITIQFDRYLAPLIFIFGVVGNLLNILVLSQRTFRTNSCAWIFLTSSFVNLISILSGLITIMIGAWGNNPANTIGWICKLRAFLVFSTRTMALWLTVLATIDRWLLSSVDAERRRKASLKNIQRWSIIIIILSIFLYSQQLYCYEANLIDTPLKCYGKTVVCRYLTDISFAVMTIGAPLIGVILFGLLTVSNVHHSQNRTGALPLAHMNATGTKSTALHTSNLEGRAKHKTDRSLLRMLFIQVIMMAIFTLPLTLDKFYSSFTGEDLSATKLAINDFVYDVAVLVYFISNGMPFYIYTLFGGSIFRKALHDFIIMMKRKLMCH